MFKRNPFKAQLFAFHDEVTGSKFLLVISFPDGFTRRILIDCGYFQEPKYLRFNYVEDIDPKSIDAMVVTHEHIDHIGLIPKFVKDGYSNPIYMTSIAKAICPDFLQDACNQQEETANEMRKRYPNEAKKFRPLYFSEDVQKAQQLFVGVSYRKTIEILPGIELTFFENGHLLGAGMILLQCKYQDMQDINLFFTGDYRTKSPLYPVPVIPSWVRNLPLIMVHESTYGSTSSTDIKQCFKSNVLISFLRRENILIGAFAQGRMQEILYDFKIMDDDGLIPKDYTIYVDSPLGIKTTLKYRDILSWYNPETANFISKQVVFVDPLKREAVLRDPNPKIIITASGMLSNGPAKTYVPFFLERPDTMIHLVGYAAEGTLARALLDAKRDEIVHYNSKELKKKAIIKTTREKSSHATADEMINFIRQFKNIQFLAINHGSADNKKIFQKRVIVETRNSNVEVIGRDKSFVFYQNATKQVDYNDMLIKEVPNTELQRKPSKNGNNNSHKGKPSRRGKKKR